MNKVISPQARLIAFYLPQFHPIPENNVWWGKGFTEWTNVVSARPRFKEHYQPHLPADLGFYDLRVPEVRDAQAKLAQAYGIHGFCYYHYWFNGRRLLNRVFDEVLDSGEPDINFCLCWANESWRRNWQGQHQEVLIEQTYSHSDDLNHIHWLERAFKDPRYIRVDDKPLFLVYRAQDLPDAGKTIEIWREEARRLGIGELYLCCVETDGFNNDPASLGFDAAVEFPPHQNTAEPIEPPSSSNRNTEIFAYEDFATASQSKFNRDYVRHPCVVPGWDNSARRRLLVSLVMQGSSPEKYANWLRAAITYAQEKPEDGRLVFVNAWNEWAEGAHLEPDKRYGTSYLEATFKALDIPPHVDDYPSASDLDFEPVNLPMTGQPDDEFDADNYYYDEGLARALDEIDFWKQKYFELEAYTRRLIGEQGSLRYLSKRLVKETGSRVLPRNEKR